MKRQFHIDVDSRPGRGKGYRNPTVVSHQKLDTVAQMTDEELRVLENPLERIYQTKAWLAAAKRRDEILALIRKAK